MPTENEDIESVMEKADEDILDDVSSEARLDNVDGRFIADQLDELKNEAAKIKDESYAKRIENALSLLENNNTTYLTREALKTYSPKFLKILEKVTDKENVGLHLIYSQFRTLEGIGILKLIFEANGMAEFKLKKDESGQWDLDIKEEDMNKPKFALYTGKEESDVKEIIRNIYNSTWENVPKNIVDKLKEKSGTNNMGEIIKILMITASGAEGISLRNCRFVHIVEPYWHPVRTEQVIGRARRICSHKDLPQQLRNVKVYIYLMTFSQKLLDSDVSIELRLKDKGKRNKSRPLTSDEALYEISTIKRDINKQLLKAIKESAFDCALHTTSESSEPLVCFSFGPDVNPDSYTFTPSLTGEEKDVVTKINIKKETWKAKELKIAGKVYALRQETGDVYDYDSYKQALKNPEINPTLVGKLQMGKDKKYKFTKL